MVFVMWQKLGLVGRDKLLKKEIWPRVKNPKPFLLIGPSGIGKTAILEWAYEACKAKKAKLSALNTVRENLQEICRGWGLTVTDEEGAEKAISKANLAHLEKAVFKAPPGVLFVDEFDKATPAFIRRLKPLAERHVLIAAGKPNFKKEELKRLTWGMAEIKVPALSPKDRLELSKRMVAHFGTTVAPSEIANASRGFPARILALCRGEVETKSVKVEGEEIDLSPVFLLALAGLVAVRYIAVGLESTDLYILGGLGMGLGVFARFFLYRGMSRR